MCTVCNRVLKSYHEDCYYFYDIIKMLLKCFKLVKRLTFQEMLSMPTEPPPPPTMVGATTGAASYILTNAGGLNSL